MVNLNELKNITDTQLSHLAVDEELKTRTLKMLDKKSYLWPKKILIPAACAATLVLVVGTSILSPPWKQAPQNSTGNNAITVLADTGEKSGTNVQDSTFSPEVQVLESWSVETMEDAKKYMDGAVLTPSYLPQNTILKEIIAAGPGPGDVIAIMMEFELEGRTFTITQDKDVAQKMNPGNSKEVDINGAKAFVSSTSFDNNGSTIYSTTVRWYKGSNMYAVQGSISEEEAIKVAKSLE